MECTHCPWDLIEFYFRMGLRYKDIKSVLGSGHLTSEKMTQRDGTFCRKGNADLEVLISQKCLHLIFYYLIIWVFFLILLYIYYLSLQCCCLYIVVQHLKLEYN